MDLIIGILIGLSSTYILEQVLQRNKTLRNEFWEYHKPIFGYHVHHSTFGIPFIIVGLFYFFSGGSGFLFLGIGTGIILMHTYSSREFIFIEKSNKERKNKVPPKK